MKSSSLSIKNRFLLTSIKSLLSLSSRIKYDKADIKDESFPSEKEIINSYKGNFKSKHRRNWSISISDKSVHPKYKLIPFLIKFYPDFLEEYLEYLKFEEVVYLMKFYQTFNSERLVNKKWLSFYKTFIKKPSYHELYNLSRKNNFPRVGSFYLWATSKLDDKNLIDVDWQSLLDDFKDREFTYPLNREETNIFGIISKHTFSKNPKSAKELMHDTDFKKLPAKIRGGYYAGFISAGLLDVKIARRIRSDASMSASEKGAQALIQERNLYPDFKNLILQFVDVKHPNVQQVIANTVPDDIVPYLMGFDDHYAKEALQKRLGKITKSQGD